VIDQRFAFAILKGEEQMEMEMNETQAPVRVDHQRPEHDDEDEQDARCTTSSCRLITKASLQGC
jgi:hypothetical protein